MSTNVNDKIKKLSPAQRKKVEARADELIAEEMTLRELRHARKLTQVRMARLSESPRTVLRALKSAAICCYPRSARRFRRWAGTCRWSPSSPTVRQSFFPELRNRMPKPKP